MSEGRSSGIDWIRVVQIIGVVLLLWAAITLVSGLLFAQVDPEIGREYRFADVPVAGYETMAWAGGAIGLVLVVVTYFLSKKG